MVWMESHLGQGMDRRRMPKLPATVVDSVALLSSESWPATPTLAAVGAVPVWEEVETITLIILTITAAVREVAGVAEVCRPDMADINIELTNSRDEMLQLFHAVDCCLSRLFVSTTVLSMYVCVHNMHMVLCVF